MIGDIMRISRLRMGTDGKGVSTLVAFFGCPLHCKYCINDFCHEKEWSFNEAPRGAYSPKELIQILQKDDIYYKMSGGGITFGGGEPLLQSAFIHEVCKLADSAWKMRIETSLNIPWEQVEAIVDDIDEWIIDIKDMNSDIYELYTEVSQEHVLNNLYRLIAVVDKSKLHIRVPCIKDFNTDEDVQKSVEWIESVLEVEPEVFTYYVIPEINDKVHFGDS